MLDMGFCAIGSHGLPPRPEVPIRGSSFHCSSQERAVTREYGPLAGLRPRPAPTRTSTPRATTTALGSGGKTPTASAFPGWEFLLRLGFCPSGSRSLSPRPEGPFLGLIFVFRLKNEAWHENTAHQQVFVRCPHRAPALTPWGATAAHGPGPEPPMESAFPRWQFVPGMGFCASAPPGLPPRRQASLLGLVVAVGVKNEPWTEM